MTSYVKARFDGKAFVPIEPLTIPVPEGTEVEVPLKVPDAEPKKRRLGGWLQGQIWISPDFDAPLEDFKEYME